MAQSEQKVHSKEQIIASRELGGRSRLQHSQFGFMRSMAGTITRCRTGLNHIRHDRARRYPINMGGRGHRIVVLTVCFIAISFSRSYRCPQNCPQTRGCWRTCPNFGCGPVDWRNDYCAALRYAATASISPSSNVRTRSDMPGELAREPLRNWRIVAAR
jgi:hypothetical protein